MASNINQVVLIVSIASLLVALFPQAESALISKSPVPVDAKTRMNHFIKSSMILGMQKTREHLQAIEMQVRDPATSEPTLQCLQECKDVYKAAIGDMKNTIDDMESENYYKVNMDISSVSTNVDTCSECYREKVGEDLEVKNFNNWVMGITSDCLDKLETITS